MNRKTGWNIIGFFLAIISFLNPFSSGQSAQVKMGGGSLGQGMSHVHAPKTRMHGVRFTAKKRRKNPDGKWTMKISRSR